MKASNVGDLVTAPVLAIFALHPGQRICAHHIAAEACMGRQRVNRALGELSSKGVIRSGNRDTKTHVKGFWLSSDKKAENLLNPEVKPTGHIAEMRVNGEFVPLNPAILRPLIREGAGQAAPGIVIHASVYDQVRA